MKILVGVAGSIAAYRSADFVKELVKLGHEVRVVLTQSAEKFVTPKTLETFSGNTVATHDAFSAELIGTDHIAWARWADRIVVYGATANFLGRLANGLGEDFLSLQILAFKGPSVILAPAMNTAMWENPLVQKNVKTLATHGFVIKNPIQGTLACGEVGTGHIAPHAEIIDALDVTPAVNSLFHGKKILISGGPMRTRIDPVRFIQNQSSGAVSVYLAQEFTRRGAIVTLVLGPIDSEKSTLAESVSKKLIRFDDYTRYADIVGKEFPKCDLFLSAAAVLDFEVTPSTSKQSRSELKKQKSLTIEIRPTEDIVARIARNKKPHQKVIAFALESTELATATERAREKLKSKSCEAIVLNLVDNILAADSERYQQWLIAPDDTAIALQGTTKSDLAQHLVEALEKLLFKDRPDKGSSASRSEPNLNV